MSNAEYQFEGHLHDAAANLGKHDDRVPLMAPDVLLDKILKLRLHLRNIGS